MAGPRVQGGWTPLCWAAFKGRKDVVDVLIAEGADVNKAGGGVSVNIRLSDTPSAAAQLLTGQRTGRSCCASALRIGGRPSMCVPVATTRSA